MTGEGTTGEAAEAREMRILADILALTLDDQPGAADAALRNIKARAREGGVTAGALKDAWRRLQGATPRHREAVFSPAAHDGAAASLARMRMEVAELHSQVALAEHGRRQDALRLAVAGREARLLATLAGALAGAAVTALLFAVFGHG